MTLLNPNVLKVSIFLFLTGGIILAVAKDLKSTLFRNKKVFMLYMIGLLVTFGLAGFFTSRNMFGASLLGNNLAIQTWFILLGILHLWLGNRLFEWKEENHLLMFFLFSCVAILLGSIGFLFVIKYLGLGDLHFFFWSGVILFFTPAIIVLLYLSVFNIPRPVYQKWYYPEINKLTKPDKEELRNPVLLTLEIMKRPGGPVSKIKAKAPENMSFSRFFFHFVSDYNLHNPENPIAVKDKAEQTYGWVFYSKTNFLTGWRFVNPELTINRGGLRENQVVLCKRMGL